MAGGVPEVDSGADLLMGSESEAPVTDAARPLIEVDGVKAPPAPERLSDTGLNPVQLGDLTLKMGATTTQFTTEWASHELRLPPLLIDELIWALKSDHEVDILGQEGPLNYRYSLTDRGRERASRLNEVSGYVGPTPVPLRAYSEMLHEQWREWSSVPYDAVREAVSDLVLSDDVIEVAALAAASGRSLFMFGPSGNGKTTVGHLLHSVFEGELWIPHAIQVDSHVIRLYDPQVHEPAEFAAPAQTVDQRWIRIKRPFVLAGGEMTLDELDLSWSPALRFYEAPPHMKANGGTFMIDDFGRQRMRPEDLLNRWIVPLERRIDYLTLTSGQKIEVPFDQMLIVSTNLSVDDVADPAFLRRMGYRLHLHTPSEEDYREIFRRYARHVGVEVDASLIEGVVERYQSEGRDLRASEPRDLIERSRDICKLRGIPFTVTPEILAAAWRGYFGNQ